jgi:cyclophilin family peptidyl-prolyl cis-trans isomerase
MKRRSGVIAWVVAGACALLALAPAAASADQVVRFNTSLGNIDVRLLSADAPNTVTNFLSYVNSGAYNGTVIHRSVKSPNVIQGGGYKFDPTYSGPAGTIPKFPAITPQAAIQNEFQDSNVRGTIAMALTSSSGTTNLNSATDQWFFNVGDNSASLDPQKFTVFGKVVNDASLAVMDAIAAEPVDTTDTSPNGSLPVKSTSVGLTDPNNLIYVNSITLLNYPAPTVSISKPKDKSEFQQGQVVTPLFTCADPAGGPGLQSCTGAKTLDTSLLGTFQYTVTATDNAGDTASQSISYTVLPYFIPKAPKTHPPLLVPPYHTTSGGRVSLGLLCTEKELRCIGKLRLLAGRKHTLVGSTNYSVGPERTWEQKLRLNKTGRRLLHKGHGKLAVTVALTPQGKHTHTTKHKLTLRVH